MAKAYQLYEMVPVGSELYEAHPDATHADYSEAVNDADALSGATDHTVTVYEYTNDRLLAMVTPDEPVTLAEMTKQMKLVAKVEAHSS